jgi:hypothetical protein
MLQKFNRIIALLFPSGLILVLQGMFGKETRNGMAQNCISNHQQYLEE